MKSLYNAIQIVCVFLLLTCTLNLSAQRAYLFGPDVTVNADDTVVVHLDDFSGFIQWQRSLDALSWDDLPGETSDTLLFVADTTSYLRAVVQAGDCDPFFSDTTLVSVYRTTTEAFMVEKQGLTLLSDSAQIAAGQYTFGEELEDVQIGDVLVGNQGAGYIRRVTGIIPDKNGTILETEQGALTDVVEQISLSDSLIITMSDNADKAFINGKPVPIQSLYLIPGAKIDSDKGIIDLSGVLFSVDIESGGTLGKLTASIPNGHILFEPVFYREFDVRYFPPRVNYFTLKAGGNIDFDLEVAVDADLQFYNVERSIRILQVVIGPIPIGPVPMLIEYSLEKKFKASVGVSGEISFGFESDFNVEFGASYNRQHSPRWTPLFDYGHSFSTKPFNASLSANAFAQFGIGPRLDVTIAGMVGPYLTIEPYLKGSLNASWPWTYNFALDAGLNSRLGFEVGILNLTLINYHTTIPGPSWSILDVTNDYEHETPIVETSDVTNVQATTASAGGNVLIEGLTAVTQRGVVWNTTPNPTLTSNQGYTNDGAGEGSFTSNMTGLTAETTYYVRAYATNSGGTSYGKEKEFTTEKELFKPTVETDPITNITQNSAKSGGNVTDDGGSEVTARGICYSTSPNPTIEDNIVAVGSGTGSFSAQMTGLSPNTTYYVRAYATNSTGTGYGNQRNFTTDPDGFVCGSTITDADGNTYNTVLIGDQCWMQENLKTTKYRNGSSIAYPGSNTSAWANNTTGAYAWYDNNIAWKNDYGALYNWHAVNNSNGLCPVGWRVPTHSDTETLSNYLGLWHLVGGKLKSTRTHPDSHPRWNAPNTGATNETGYSAYPGGVRDHDGSFALFGEAGWLWTSTSYSDSHAYCSILSTDNASYSYFMFAQKSVGASVRCIKE